MAQKILAGRCADPMLTGTQVSVKVDQVVLSRSPLRAIAEARELGLKKTSVEVAMVYDAQCVVSAESRSGAEDVHGATTDILGHGIVVARPGIGFAAPVHLERFASPARLCVTDDPRLAGVGGVGMLTLVVAPSMLGQALAQGAVTLRPPRSVQVLLSGRTRPFVCARDIALELVRRGLGDAVSRIEAQDGAPVVIEFGGPSARLLSVGERAVLAGLAPQLGAAGAIFLSDERTEVFLRDQRRSKAHRALSPDAGAPCAEVLNIDLGAVDPLYMDEAGNVRTVRDISGKPVSQVILGGDSGCTLRDMFAAAALLKSKRVPPSVEFLLAIPSRQMLEVLSGAGALTDLLATGARLIEPDARVMTGQLYPGASGALSARTHDLEPTSGPTRPIVTASAETLAYAVANGEMGDPRSFKRPVRVTIPRELPTDDVLVLRDRKGAAGDPSKKANIAGVVATPWKGAQTLTLLEGAQGLSSAKPASENEALAIVCTSLEDVRVVGARAVELSSSVRAIVGSLIPSGTVALLSGLGIAALHVDAAGLKSLKGQKTLALPEPSKFGERASTSVAVGNQKVAMTWLAVGVERTWAASGTTRGPVARPKG